MSTKTTDYEKKLIEMRYQMQENQVSMDDCFKDLESWTQDIKVKEKKILEDPNYLKNTNKVSIFYYTLIVLGKYKIIC